ncbi:MAG: maltose alpha-D-glucosyltransferase [Chloroflexi bacterium 54-19]|nr:MAG: maltose alpha-D-glucosyltransferase [Chloroflexi bacterium 54-19]
MHVKSFFDSNADGVGDFKGLTKKLDYLEQLGVNCIWLLPFYESPLRDDGYDVADYYAIHPDYGTANDFKAFLREAHKRGLHVLIDLVINHTSDKHPWFEAARRSKDPAIHDFYVWSDTPHRYEEARIIFTDTEKSNWSWDPVAKQYYWHRFFSHQPDLNFEHPPVRKALLEVIDYWLSMGVDGFRVDAVPYLFEEEGTNSENLPQTHTFLKEMRAYIDEHFPGRILLAEANQWPTDLLPYFGEGDEFHMAFNFPLMPRIFMALRREDRQPIIDVIEQLPAIPDLCQWAIFLRNHDELTLEMVTEEEREYMWNEYAADPQMKLNIGIRCRLATLLDNSRRRLELVHSLLLTLPGTPVLYYGDEIEMGDNVLLGDRMGVRTPMQWSAELNAGFSEAPPEKLYCPVITDPLYNYIARNVAAEANNSSSFLNWMQRVLQIRRKYPVFGRGQIRFLDPSNPRVLAYLRSDGKNTILVVNNLSRFSQAVELNLGDYKGAVPREMFGDNPFPAIGKLPYLLTLGPHSFFWFHLDGGPAKKRRKG